MCVTKCVPFVQLNTGQLESPRGKDLNIEPVWMQGVTGRGVVVAFMDNGTVHYHAC